MKSYCKDGLVPNLREIGLKSSSDIQPDDVILCAKQIERDFHSGSNSIHDFIQVAIQFAIPFR